MAYRFAHVGSIIVTGTTYRYGFVCPDDIPSLNLPKPMVDSYRMGKDSGSGMYYRQVCRPVIDPTLDGDRAIKSSGLLWGNRVVLYGESLQMSAISVGNLIGHLIGISDGTHCIYGYVYVDWRDWSHIRRVSVSTYTYSSNNRWTGIQLTADIDMTSAGGAGLDACYAAVQRVIGLPTDTYHIQGPESGFSKWGQWNAVPLGGDLTYYTLEGGTLPYTVSYDYQVQDKVDFIQSAEAPGYWSHRMRNVCSNAYLDAFEQLPNVSANGIANILEASSALKGVSEKFLTGFNTIGRDLVNTAKSVSDPRDDWLTWRYVYNTTKMDIDEMSDVLARCRNLVQVIKDETSAIKTEGFASEGEWSACSHVSCAVKNAVRPGTLNYAKELQQHEIDWAARVSEAPERVQRYLMPEVYGSPYREIERSKPVDRVIGAITPSSTLELSDLAYMYENDLFPIQYKGQATLDWITTDSPDNILDGLGARLTAANAWDMIPFSFVADWFTGIGNTLSAAESWNEARHLMIYAEWMTVVHKRDNAYTFMRLVDHPSLPPVTIRKSASNKTIAFRAADTISLFT